MLEPNNTQPPPSPFPETSKEHIERARELADKIGPVLHGYPSFVIGTAFGLLLYSIGFDAGADSVESEILVIPAQKGEPN